MSRLANKFINPLNSFTYAWPINHSEESEVDLSRNVAHGANTANTGLVRQQGDDSPMVFQLQGKILQKAQLEAFMDWWLLCKTQTIYFEKYDGDLFEVLITGFKPVQQKTIHNPKDSANAPLWYWSYSMEIEVVRAISGIYAGVV